MFGAKTFLVYLPLSTFVSKRNLKNFVSACPNITTSVSSQQFKANFRLTFDDQWFERVIFIRTWSFCRCGCT